MKELMYDARVTARCSVEVAEKLHAMAREEGMKLSEFVRQRLADIVHKRDAATSA